MKQLKSGRLKIKPSNIHGYGVFAGQHFARGDLIEECATIEITDPPIIRSLTEGMSQMINYIHKVDDAFHIALGNGSLYNHANKPNAELTYNPRLNIMQIRSLTKISRGEEILMYYGNHWSKTQQHRIVQAKEHISLMRAFFRLPLSKVAVFVGAITLLLKYKVG
jgi:uncharacterized protein